jgi:hypothetical protein
MSDALADWLRGLDPVVLVLIIGLLTGLIALVVRVAVTVWPLMAKGKSLAAAAERWQEVADVALGRPANPDLGIEAIPSWGAQIAQIKAEVTPNHGGSSHDQLMDALNEIKAQNEDLATQSANLENTIALESAHTAGERAALRHELDAVKRRVEVLNKRATEHESTLAGHEARITAVEPHLAREPSNGVPV